MKLRWVAHASDDVGIFVYVEFIDPIREPNKIRYWAQIAYIPETDSYGAMYFSGVDREKRYADMNFDTIQDAMMAVEQLLFEEGIRDDTT